MEIPPQPELLSKAQHWFQTESTLKPSNKSGTHPLLGTFRLPDWQHYRVQFSGGASVIEVPLLHNDHYLITLIEDEETGIKKTGVTRLLLRQNSDESFTPVIMRIFGDSAYLAKEGNQFAHNSFTEREADFSGDVFFYDWEENFLGANRYVNGQFVAKIEANLGKNMNCYSVQTMTFILDTESTAPFPDSDGSGAAGTGENPGGLTTEAPSPPSTPTTPSGHWQIQTTTTCFYSDGGGGGGGSTGSFNPFGNGVGGSGNNNPPQEPENDLLAITKLNLLDEDAKPKLIERFNIWKSSSPYNEKIYTALKEAPIKFTFKIDSTLSGQGGFIHEDSSIVFKSIDAINEFVLWEEFFHAYQHHFYPGGLGGFENIGRSNMEFEAKLYRDLTFFGCCNAFLSSNAPPDIIESYQEWVFEISDYKTILPTSFENIESKYWEFLNDFAQYSPAYNYPVDYRLPNAMFHLFND